MNWNFVVRTLSVVGCSFFLTNATALAQVHGHAAKEAAKSTYFLGDQSFEAKKRYTLILKSDEGRREMAALKKRASEMGHIRASMRSKPRSTEHQIYLQLLEEMPSVAPFRVVRATDSKNGDIEVQIESKEGIPVQAALKSPEILAFSEIASGHSVTTVVLPDQTIKSLIVPDGWTKNDGYKDIGNRFRSGAKVVKTSLVFDLSGDEGKYFYQLSFADVIRSVEHENHGVVYGYGSSAERKIAWWTQDLTQEQVNKLVDSKKVINIIAHD